MNCKNCGSKLNEDDKFCNECGTPVDDAQRRRMQFYETDESKENDQPIDKKGNQTAGLYVIIAILVMVIFVLVIILLLNTAGNSRKAAADANDRYADQSMENANFDTVEKKDPVAPDKNKKGDTDKEDTEAGDEEDETAADDGWKQLYLDYLSGINQPGNDGRYVGGGLLYVNDDDIPELCLEGDCEATGCVVLTYGNGELDVLQTSRLNYNYIEKGNLLDNCGGHMGYYYDYIYSIKNGKWESAGAGEYEEDYEKSDLEHDKFVYNYTWDGKSVTEDEYSKKLKSVYDAEKAKMAKIYPLTELESLIKTGNAPFTEHRYELIVNDVTWKEAEKLCEQKGGYLATLTSKEEFEKVSKQIEKEDKTNISFFVGATRDTSYYKNNASTEPFGYFWIQEGAEIVHFAYRDDFDFWLPDEPSYTGQDAEGNEVDEKYVDLIYRKADGRCYLNDVADDILKEAPSFAGKIGYICEYE